MKNAVVFSVVNLICFFIIKLSDASDLMVINATITNATFYLLIQLQEKKK